MHGIKGSKAESVTEKMEVSLIAVEYDNRMRAALREALQVSRNISLLHVASTVQEAIEWCRSTPFEDFDMVLLGGTQLSYEELKRSIDLFGGSHGFAVDLLLVMRSFNQNLVVSALSLGIRGILMENVSACTIHAAIWNLRRFGMYFSPQIVSHLLSSHGVRLNDPDYDDLSIRRQFETLTESEKRIAKLLAEGLTNKEIAEKLVMENSSVRSSISRMLKKLDMKNRTEVVTNWYKSNMDFFQ